MDRDLDLVGLPSTRSGCTCIDRYYSPVSHIYHIGMLQDSTDTQSEQFMKFDIINVVTFRESACF